MPHLQAHQVQIIKYGKNLIKVKIWEFLGQKNGEIDEIALKQVIIKELNISLRQLTTYMDNISQPEIEEFFVIAQILECTVNDLISGQK